MILRPGRLHRPVLAVAAALVGLLALPATEYAHDIPSSVTVLAFVKPEAHTLRVVMRVPLAAMRDVNFPLHGPGYLDLDSLAHGTLLGDAATVWIANDLRMYEGEQQLPTPRVVAARVSVPSDRSFTTYEAALAHMSGGPLGTDTELMWNQAMLDVELEYPIRDAGSRFSIEPTLARLGVRTTTVLKFMLPAGGERDFEYLGDPGLVHLDPSWYQAAARFVMLGFEHIPTGMDHLLFLLCLVIPFRSLRPLIAIATAFTVGHSVTLVASASGFAPSALWFPPLIELLIAASIVYMAIENIVGAKLERRWLVAFGFGLVHGFGFSFTLRQSMQFAGAHLAASLLSFNLGVELGQLFVLALAVPALNWLFRHAVAPRMGTIILSAFVAHTAWHWMLDRWTVLSQYQLTLPALDAEFAAAAMRTGMLLIVVVGAGWATYEFYRRLARRRDGAAALAATD